MLQWNDARKVKPTHGRTVLITSCYHITEGYYNSHNDVWFSYAQAVVENKRICYWAELPEMPSYSDYLSEEKHESQ